MIRTILLTGTRAPVTLDLARRLQRDGIRVIGADSCRFPLGRFSKAFTAHFRVPPARWDREAFVGALAGIVSSQAVDLVWPTCEEVFSVASLRGRIPCPVFLPPAEVLLRLHHKLRFAEWTRELGGGVTAPPSWEARDAPPGGDLIWKRKYSRFGCQIRTTRPEGELEPWMAQVRLEGPEFCAWALCRSGTVQALTQYRCPVRSARGAGCCFEPAGSGPVAEFMRRIARITEYTGSIACDFLGPARDGKTYVLECNPRMTSGLHLLDPGFSVGAALAGDVVPGAPGRLGAQLLVPTLLRAPRLADPARDVVGARGDLRPVLGQFLSLAEFAGIACRQGISLSEATTWDLEYNGD